VKRMAWGSDRKSLVGRTAQLSCTRKTPRAQWQSHGNQHSMGAGAGGWDLRN
jgi:hypothetical protein